MILHSRHQILIIDHRNSLETATAAQEFVQPHDAVTNFEPSLVVVVAVLALIFSLTILLLFYFKSCRNSTITAVDQQDDRRPSIFFSPNSTSGLDQKAIQNLPFFRFGVLRGSKEGLQCSVCLSKYEEAEILRLLPKCRHAFHVDCVDRWLSHHSTCPLCRTDVAVHDSSLLARSNSNLERPEDSISIGNYSNSDSIANEQVELFVEREEEESGDQESILRRSSSILSVGSTFRRLLIGEGRVPITVCRSESGDRVLHKHNHKIVFSDVVFKNRWSNVSSSDLRFLNSELIMLSRADSGREQSAEIETARGFRKTECSLSIGEEMINKKRISIELAKRHSNASFSSPTRALLGSAGAGDFSLVEGRRSVSEITLYSRFKELGWLNYSEKEDPVSGVGSGSGGCRENEEGEKKREIWFPIARKTVECFANARREEMDGRRNHRRAFN